MQNRPVVIGVGCINQKDTFDNLDEALILMEKAMQLAISDSTNDDIKKYIDEIQIPKGYWKYRDPGKWIASRNGIKDIKTSITKIGVLQQNLINSACKRIIDGDIRASIILGGESRYKKILAEIEQKDFIETELNINPDFYIKADDDLQLEVEADELGNMAVGYYSIMESSLRFKSDFNEHHKKIAKIYENFSKISTTNSLAWNDKEYTYEEILNPSDKNPTLAFPYNKFHCTSWNVNQAAALIICSDAIADLLEVPESKRVYPLASSENNHMIATLQRPDLSKSAGMNLAADFILDICKKNNISPNLYDLYSCFPVAVEMFANSLDLKELNNITVTGGMSFAGGPLNSYVLNSTVQMIEMIRKYMNVGIVTGVSGMMTKQSYALWSKNPLIEFLHKDVTSQAKEIDVPVELSDLNNGYGLVLGYTVLYSKNSVVKGVLYIEDENKKRKLITTSDKLIMKSMESEEWVGKKIQFLNTILVTE